MTRRPRAREEASTMFSTSCLRMVTENSVPEPISTSASSEPAVLARRQTSSARFRRSSEALKGLALGAAHGDARHQDRRHADADGDGLAVLAAGPATVAQLEVTADHGYFR